MKLGVIITQTDPETVFNSEASEVCPLSTLKDQYEIVRDSDRVVTL